MLIIFSLNLSGYYAAALEPERFSALVIVESQHGRTMNTCHGAAIAPNVVLTSAHCLGVEGEVASRIRIGVSSGDWLDVSEVKIHPKYNTKKRIPRYDVGVAITDKKITSKPFSLFASTRLHPGESFTVYNLGNLQNTVSLTAPVPFKLVTADVRSMLHSFLEMNIASFEYPILAAGYSQQLADDKSPVVQQVTSQFQGLIFTLYSQNKTSLCSGDSGSPAIVEREGHPGIIAIGTAVTDLEKINNPKCKAGGSSIFTLLNPSQTVDFLRGLNLPLDMR